MEYKKIKYIIIWIITLCYINIEVKGQSKDSLDHYLQIAIKNNPSIKTDSLIYRAATVRVNQAGTLTNPELEVGFYPEPMDIVGGRQVAEFKVMQMFSWFGSRKTARKEAVHQANGFYQDFRSTKDNLYWEVYSQWYLLSTLQYQLINNQKNKKLLLDLNELALKKYSSSNSGSNPSPGMSDVLQIQLEMMEFDLAIENLISQIKVEKAKFNILLNRPLDQEVYLSDSIQKIDFLLEEDKFINQMKEQNPLLVKINEEGLSYKAKAESDRKMSYPMLGIGVEYMLNKKTNDPMFAMGNMNGKDMFMPMFSISIPIYRNKYKSQKEESAYWQQANREKYINTFNTLQIEFQQIKYQMEESSRKILLYDKQIKLADAAYRLVIKEFISGKKELSNVIQIRRQLMDYELKKAESIASYNKMIVSLQKLSSFSPLKDVD